VCARVCVCLERERDPTCSKEPERENLDLKTLPG
jgi:hypothetical protein